MRHFHSVKECQSMESSFLPIIEAAILPNLRSEDNVAVGFSDVEDVASELCDKSVFQRSIERAIVTVYA